MKVLKKVGLIKIFCFLGLIALVIYVSFGIYSYSIISKYNDKVYPNVYVNNHDISGLKKNEVVSEIKKIKTDIEEREMLFIANGNKYTYKFKDFGITIDDEKLSNEILTYPNDLSYLDKIHKISVGERTDFSYELIYDEKILQSFIEQLKSKVDCKVVEGKLVVDEKKNVSYDNGSTSFSLDVSKTVDYIKNNVSDMLSIDKIELIGSSVKPKYNNLSTINHKMSTFTTKFNDKVSRGRNLANAAKRINGTILQPNEIFSFYKYAGPYSGDKGYTYYDGVMGNGVCQVATTVYNAQLLAGLKTVERYSHAYKMTYVAGGLDATVAANRFGPVVDLKFKNTYNYPIYISAFTNGGNITIEIWSNANATDGKTYKTESKQIGLKGYSAYLITYKDGKQIERKYIDSTWYTK